MILVVYLLQEYGKYVGNLFKSVLQEFLVIDQIKNETKFTINFFNVLCFLYVFHSEIYCTKQGFTSKQKYIYHLY